MFYLDDGSTFCEGMVTCSIHDRANKCLQKERKKQTHMTDIKGL